MPVRAYRMERRAESQRRTATRIVEAALALYERDGPAATTISAVAKRAGVQRLTVYRHYQDEHALFTAVAAHWARRHPRPSPRQWAAMPDSRSRLRAALEALYQYYARAFALLDQVRRDGNRFPAGDPLRREFEAFGAEARAALVTGWGASGRTHAWIVALVTHALDPATWASLVRDAGLTPADAARVLARAIADLARDPYA